MGGGDGSVHLGLGAALLGNMVAARELTHDAVDEFRAVDEFAAAEALR